MNEKITIFKQGFHNIVELCNDIDSTAFQQSVAALLKDIDDLTEDDEIEQALSLLDELIIHLNGLDEELLEPYGDIIEEIQSMADGLIDEAGST